MTYDDTVGDYQQLLERLASELPDLAAQLSEEVGRGRRLTKSELGADDLEGRQHRLSESHFERLGSRDVAMVPYTEDERLDLGADVILTQARAMYSSRQAILEMIESQGIESRSVTFTDSEGVGGEPIMLDTEVPQTERMYTAILRLLGSSEASVREADL